KSFERVRAGYEDRYNVYRLDPNALIPTGPGLPRWTWQTIRLSWRGPVERDQRLHLMLASPRVNRMLAFLRVALTGLLLACVAGGGGRGWAAGAGAVAGPGRHPLARDRRRNAPGAARGSAPGRRPGRDAAAAQAASGRGACGGVDRRGAPRGRPRGRQPRDRA